MNPRNADWAGKIHKRFRWLRFRFEWGRRCYKTDCCGDTLESWWEWEQI